MENTEEKTGQLSHMTVLERKLLDNFFWSFHHSQGDPTLQRFLAAYIVKQLNPGEWSDIETLHNRMTTHIKRLRIPKEHNPVVTKDVGMNFTEEWKKYFVSAFDPSFAKKINAPNQIDLDIPINMTFSPAPNPAVLLYEIIRSIIEQDSKYQSEHRKNRKNDSDSHASFFQTYVLDKKEPQTPELQHLYQAIRQFIQNYDLLNDDVAEVFIGGNEYRGIVQLRREFNLLRKAWEENHPGQQFIPDGFSLDVSPSL